VDDGGPSHLVCSTRVVPPEDAAEDLFPFEFEASYELRLHARGIRGRLTFLNTGSRPQPLSAGFHPYLYCDRAGAVGPPRIRIPAAKEWELTQDDEPTPTGRIAPVAAERDFREGRALPEDEHWDHVFTDLASDEDGWVSAWTEQEGTVVVRSGDPRGRSVPIRTRHYLRVPLLGQAPNVSAVPHIQLYTPPGRSSVCLEPLANPPNALNLTHVSEAAVKPLAPGESRSFLYDVGMEVVEEGGR
jgi:galactose mutarotase-like enzyme